MIQETPQQFIREVVLAVGFSSDEAEEIANDILELSMNRFNKFLLDNGTQDKNISKDLLNSPDIARAYTNSIDEVLRDWLVNMVPQMPEERAWSLVAKIKSLGGKEGG